MSMEFPRRSVGGRASIIYFVLGRCCLTRRAAEKVSQPVVILTSQSPEDTHVGWEHTRRRAYRRRSLLGRVWAVWDKSWGVSGVCLGLSWESVESVERCGQKSWEMGWDLSAEALGCGLGSAGQCGRRSWREYWDGVCTESQACKSRWDA